MRRKGLTLVEMLVALALTIFMMAILSEAFVTGLKAFRKLKAIADMDSQLRTVATVLRRDLQADHFDGNRRLSSYRLGLQGQDGLYDRPHQGFFCVREGNNALGTSIQECTDANRDSVSRPSSIDNNNDAFAFTMRLTGNRPEAFFYGAVPRRSAPLPIGPPEPAYPPDNIGQYTSRFDAVADGKFASQWCEVIYFLEQELLRPNGPPRVTYDESTGNSTNVYKLHRVQLLLVPEAFTVPTTDLIDPMNPTESFRRVEQWAAWDDGATISLIQEPTKFDNYYSGNAGQATQYKHDVSAWAERQGAGGNYRYRYNTPADIQFRERRFGEFLGNYRKLGLQSTNSAANNQLREGADLLAVNVISWDIKVYDPYAIKGTSRTNPNQIKYLPEFVDLGHGRTGTTNLPMPTTDGVYDYAWNTDPNAPNATPATTAPLFRGVGNNSALPRIYDTWTNRHYFNATSGDNWNYLDATNALRNLPYAGSIQAIQIRIRVWDEVTRQTREMTIVQDM